MKYRKKPVVIEAIQWTGLNLEEIKSFVGGFLQYDIIDTAWEVDKGAPHVNMIIKTLEGEYICRKGDFIIKGVHGEFYPCKPDIFEKTYEKEMEQSNIVNENVFSSPCDNCPNNSKNGGSGICNCTLGTPVIY